MNQAEAWKSSVLTLAPLGSSVKRLRGEGFNSCIQCLGSPLKHVWIFLIGSKRIMFRIFSEGFSRAILDVDEVLLALYA